MTRLVLEQVTDFGDFTRGRDLGEFLIKQSNSNGCWNNNNDSLSDVRVSPDGRHIHVILRKPSIGLLTYDKYQRPPQLIQSQKHLDLGLAARTSPIVDVLYLDPTTTTKNRDTAGGGGVALLAVVFENGNTEFWKFLECKAGWHLLQTSDLCNSPRAKVVSVSACSNFIVWCEERPPSESSPALLTNHPTRNNFRYCICKRSYEVEEGAIGLGGVKIALHNSPRYTVVSSGEKVYLLPGSKEKCCPRGISKFFLAWSPLHDTFRVSTACNGTLLRKDSPLAKESDFKKLITDCVGYLSALAPPDIYGFSPTGCGGLLLLLSTGWVCLLQRDGAIRRVYSLADNCVVDGDGHYSLNLYQETLALTVGRTLYLIDTKCGRELEKIALRREGLLYVNRTDRKAPHLLSESGLFVVMLREADLPRGWDSDPGGPRPSPLGAAESLRPGALLVEAVFEEACRYYQQRSLSSTQLTVEKLKRGGMFQAPISLASILRDHLSGAGGGGGAPGQDKLRGSLEAELKGLVALEEVKGSVVKGSVEEVEAVLESLVQQEVGRLLSSSAEPDGDALLYLNSIFGLFPRQAWKAAQAALQLRCNGEGSLSIGATPEVWKNVLLNPIPGPKKPTKAPPYANGQPKHKPGLKLSLPNSVSGSNLKPSSDPSPLAANMTLPVFELLCRSVLRHQPSWLPRLVDLAQQQQQQQGSAGMGLGSSWSFSSGGAGRGGESGETLPLYKRALSVLGGAGSENRDLEVELLLVSGRPNAVLQALRILMGGRQWERVTRVAQQFCRQSPLLNKEVFTVLLCEVAQHRDLDPYLDLLWALCPEDITVTSILNTVLKNIPSSSSSTPPYLSSSSPSPSPFAEPQGCQLTVGLLKPLLTKVLQRETKPSQRYADILHSPTYPPPTPPRLARGAGLSRAATEPACLDQTQQPHCTTVKHKPDPPPLLDQQRDPPIQRTVPGGRVMSPPHAV